MRFQISSVILIKMFQFGKSIFADSLQKLSAVYSPTP